MTSTRVIIISILFFGMMGGGCAFGQQRGEIDSKLKAEFALLDARNNLYGIDSDFVVQPGFDSLGRLLALRVVPKYFFEDIHPEWMEPDIPPALKSVDYRNALARLGRVAPIGDLNIQGGTGVTTNLRTRFWDQYGAGMIERVVSPSDSTDWDELIASFTILYFREVSGRVEAKEGSTPGNYVLKIDGTNYWTSKDEFDAVAVGQTVTIQGASSAKGLW